MGRRTMEPVGRQEPVACRSLGRPKEPLGRATGGTSTRRLEELVGDFPIEGRPMRSRWDIPTTS
jgi:hypothetical protein